jgi:lipoate-protein ligase A
MLIALPNAFGDAATNMAIDAALLASMPLGLAAFRHYGWLEPATTFGYAQHYHKVRSELASVHAPIEPIQGGATLTRRMTGGGIVDHRNDWTYALILHSSVPAASTPATNLYAQIHHAISLSLAKIGIDSRLAPCPRHCEETPVASDIPAHCFITPSANDVLRPDGQKIAGAAMKRSRQGLLIQGSLDRSSLPETLNFIRFQNQLLEHLASTLDLELSELEDSRPLFKSERIEREKQRFADDAWNQRR